MRTERTTAEHAEKNRIPTGGRPDNCDSRQTAAARPPSSHFPICAFRSPSARFPLSAIRCPSASGFSLLEILVAMTLFTMAVTAILALYAVAAASHRRAIHQANARLIATRVAADLRARPPAQIQPPARENQTLSGVDPAYKYDVTFESVGGGSALRATIRVHWPSERGEEEIVIPTVISRGSP